LSHSPKTVSAAYYADYFCLSQTARKAAVAVASATIFRIVKLNNLLKGVAKVTTDGNPTRNFQITRQTPYPLSHQASTLDIVLHYILNYHYNKYQHSRL